jgi:hypothetical protein
MIIMILRFGAEYQQLIDSSVRVFTTAEVESIRQIKVPRQAREMLCRAWTGFYQDHERLTPRTIVIDSIDRSARQMFQ